MIRMKMNTFDPYLSARVGTAPDGWEGSVLKLVIGAVVSVVMVGSAIAADLPRREPAPPPAPVAVGKAPIGKLPFGKGPVVARY